MNDNNKKNVDKFFFDTTTISDEIWLNTFGFFNKNAREMNSLKLTCKHWYHIASDPLVRPSNSAITGKNIKVFTLLDDLMAIANDNGKMITVINISERRAVASLIRQSIGRLVPNYTHLQISPDKKFIAAVHRYGVLDIWNIETRELAWSAFKPDHSKLFPPACFLNNGNIACPTNEGLSIYDAATGNIISKLKFKFGNKGYRSFIISSDDQYFCFTNERCIVFLCDNKGTEIKINGREKFPDAFATEFLDKDNIIFACNDSDGYGDDRSLNFFIKRLKLGSSAYKLENLMKDDRTRIITAMAVSKDNTYLALAEDKGEKITVFDLKNQKSIEIPTGKIRGNIFFSEDNQLVFGNLSQITFKKLPLDHLEDKTQSSNEEKNSNSCFESSNVI